MNIGDNSCQRPVVRKVPSFFLQAALLMWGSYKCSYLSIYQNYHFEPTTELVDRCLEMKSDHICPRMHPSDPTTTTTNGKEYS